MEGDQIIEKIISITLAAALLICLSVPAFAGNTQRTDISYTHTKVEPTYTVSIPCTLDLYLGDNFLNVEVSDAENLGEDDAIYIYLAGAGNHLTDYHSLNNYQNVSLRSREVPGVINYTLYDVLKGNKLNINVLQGYDDYRFPVYNAVLAEFGGNGQGSVIISIEKELLIGGHQDTGTYNGYIIFGITPASNYTEVELWQ